MVNEVKQGAGYLPLVAGVGAQAAGLPVSDIMMPGPVTSLSIGVMTNRMLWHPGAFGLRADKLGSKVGMDFGGAFGYKTLFTGVTNTSSRFTLGNAVLSAIESTGRRMWEGGNRSAVVAWMRDARTYGLSGYTSGTYSLEEKKIAEKAIKKGTFKLDNTVRRFLGGQSEKIESHYFKRVATKDGEKAFKLLLRNKAGGYLVKGRLMATLGTGLNVMAAASLLSIPAEWAVKNVMNKAAEHIGDAHHFLTDFNNSNLGKGYLRESFNTTGAVTERQRAVQAIYASKINPSSRMYGNEASRYHM